VDDSKADVYLIREAIGKAHIDASLYIVHDGQQAEQYIDAADREPGELCPDLILLDLNLPKKDGTEVLRHVRGSVACGKTRVLIVSSSHSPGDRAAMRELGFDGYFPKPSSYAEFLTLGLLVRKLLD
jgi:CheY-like chemotaxis protein